MTGCVNPDVDAFLGLWNTPGKHRAQIRADALEDLKTNAELMTAIRGEITRIEQKPTGKLRTLLDQTTGDAVSQRIHAMLTGIIGMVPQDS